MATGYKHRQQVRLGFYCTQALADRLEAFSKRNELSITEVIRVAVVAYLDGVDAV